jgi:hypothetical protein
MGLGHEGEHRVRSHNHNAALRKGCRLVENPDRPCALGYHQ